MKTNTAAAESATAEPDTTESSDSSDDQADSPTFDGFFREAWPDTFRLAYFLTRDRAAAEEIAQEAFAQMYGTWGRAERPHAYLRTAVVNRCQNWRRNERIRRQKLPLLAGPTATDLAVDHLADAVAALPFRQRAVVVLRYHAGLSEAEIADGLGCRPGTVKSLASRALARLEEVIR